MKILLQGGYIQFVFKDADTVALTDTKLSATETDSLGDSQSWENTNFTTLNSELFESVSAEDMILSIWSQGPRLWNPDSFRVNQEQRNV
jgi:hypothetical protein|tara:strand:+ start:1030 stop:1296 length:267 start_codon:yes stop_codon:yes gene_type:complete